MALVTSTQSPPPIVAVRDVDVYALPAPPVHVTFYVSETAHLKGSRLTLLFCAGVPRLEEADT